MLLKINGNMRDQLKLVKSAACRETCSVLTDVNSERFRGEAHSSALTRFKHVWTTLPTTIHPCNTSSVQTFSSIQIK